MATCNVWMRKANGLAFLLRVVWSSASSPSLISTFTRGILSLSNRRQRQGVVLAGSAINRDSAGSSHSPKLCLLWKNQAKICCCQAIGWFEGNINPRWAWVRCERGRDMVGGASPPVSIGGYVNSELCLSNIKALGASCPARAAVVTLLQMAAAARPPQTSSPTRPLRSPALEWLDAFMWSD